MTNFTQGGTRHPGGSQPVRRVMLAVCLLTAVAACEKNGVAETEQGVTDVRPMLESGNSQDIAGGLITRLVRNPDGSHVAVEINDDLLQDLVSREGRDEIPGELRDPLLAARLFAPHIGLSAGAEFSMTQRSWQVEEASGLFIAKVRVKQGENTVDMRMISEPDSLDRPTLWVLNDYQKR